MNELLTDIQTRWVIETASLFKYCCGLGVGFHISYTYSKSHNA